MKKSSFLFLICACLLGTGCQAAKNLVGVDTNASLGSFFQRVHQNHLDFRGVRVYDRATGEYIVTLQGVTNDRVIGFNPYSQDK